MKKTLTALFALLATISFSQISGTVSDSEGEILPGAAVVLLQGETIYSGTTTDASGRFSLEAEKGKYTLQISFISFQTKNKEIVVGAEALKLGIMVLEPSSTALDEIVLESESKLVEFHQDKRVYNVAKDLTTAGSNASEVLRNIPSVDVDIDGNISLRGSQNVRILIDGKPSGLIGTDPATALRSLQADMIERVEVITNPSARYEAQGEAGIINIVLKKQKRQGLNGNFETTIGTPDLYGASAGINYRTGQLNFFTNLGINYRKSPGGGFNNQTFTLADTSYSFNSNRDQERGGTSATLRLGADYNLTDNQSLTGTFLFRPSLGNNRVEIVYDDFNENDILTQSQSRIDEEIETKTTLEGDIHYEKTLEGKDHKWTMDFRYQNSDDIENSNINQITFTNNEQEQQKVSNQEDRENILFQTDYVKPFSEKRSFETGARASLRKIINKYEVTELNEFGIYESLELYTNNFNYDENILAAYAIYNDAIGENITYQVGLRAEYTGIETKIINENISNPREYYNLFPSAFFTWDINKQSDLQWSYSRRISRPGFRSLLPFFSFSDNRNFYSGNPNLNPEFTDSYEVGYLRFIGSASVYGGLYYRHRTGVTQRIRTVDSTGFTQLFPVNLAVQDAYGLEFTYNQPITSWWRLSANTNIFRSYTTGVYEGIKYGNANFGARGRGMTRFSFWDSDLQLSFNFRAPQSTVQGTSKGIYSADIGWSRDILKGNGTLTFNVRDIFNSRKRRGTSFGENFTNESEFQWRSRQINLTFSYRLNQKKQRGKPSNFENEDRGL